MAANKIALFGKTRRLESEIDDFLDTVSQGGILFEETLRHYIDKGPDEFFEQRQQQISDIESNGDRLVKGIVRSLYSEMLIPESRGDVLSLLQDMDYLPTSSKKSASASTWSGRRSATSPPTCASPFRIWRMWRWPRWKI